MVSTSGMAYTRGGFTLVEVVTSLSIMSVLLLGLSGAVMIGSYAIPSVMDTGQMDQRAIDSINQIRSELREAITITHRTGAGGAKLEIQINDTGVLGTPGMITYRYILSSGILTRKVDVQDAETIVSGLDDFFVELTEDGGNASVVYLRMTVDGTIQTTYEMHALLPYRPETL